MPSIDGNQNPFGLPAAKRQKVELDRDVHPTTKTQTQTPGSRIFSPFRTLGLVSPTKVAFTSVPLGKTTFQITTSVGRCLQTYDLRRGLSLVFLSRPQTPAAITAICAWKDRVFAAWGGAMPTDSRGVWVFKRGKKVSELGNPVGGGGGGGGASKEPIEQLMVLGSWVVGCSGRSIEVWKTTSLEHYTTLTPIDPSGALDGRPILTGKMCSMPTYLNKIFVGRHDGGVDIWNVGTGKLVYTLLPTTPDAGTVTALQPAPALSLLAIAYGSGALAIHNVRTDQVVLQLRSPSTTSSPIATISFRTDGLGAGNDGRRSGVMATAGADNGDVALWDLNDGGRVAGILRDAHEATGEERVSGVNKIEFLSGQPVIVSTGMDNALRTWIFDETPFSPIPRPLHSRSGHSAPITTIMFLPAGSDGCDTAGKWLLSASQDRSLYGLSLRKDAQNTELSQGKVKSKAKKLGHLNGSTTNSVRTEDLKTPEITCVACSLNRDGGMGAAANGPMWANSKATNAESTNITGWESVVTGHRGDKYARTWIWGKKKAGRWALETGDGTEVKSVAMSACGTFALVGSAGGSIVMYNLQSGIRRQTFPTRMTPAQARKSKLQQLDAADGAESHDAVRLDQGKHNKAVTGLVVDSLNRTAVSCGLDGKLKFWDFLTGQLVDELNWHPMCAITGLRHSHASDLVALSCDDLSIRVIDMETKKLVRELWGCVGQVNDFCVSNDGRWVVAASMDSTIRVWDLPTGHLVDAFRLQSTCTSLAFSATGEFLATAHADGVGINLWNNRSLFMHVPTAHIDEDAIADIAVAPTASGESGVATIEAAFADDEEPYALSGPSMTAEKQLGANMMTLSITPRNRWQTLLHLEQIKERNKPQEAPKKPQKAPFFLPSTTANSRPSENALPDTTTTTNDAKQEAAKLASERSRIATLQRAKGGADLQTSSPFTSLLRSAGSNDDDDFAPFIDYFKSLSPAKADLEIRSLDPRAPGGYGNELVTFVRALTARLKSRRDFEMVNTWMAVFLRVHGDAAGDDDEDSDRHRNRMVDEGEDEEDTVESGSLQDALAEFKAEQDSEGKRLGDLVGYCRGVVGFLRSAR